MSIDTTSLLADEARYCSFGDTVHYVNPPKIFTGCEGSYMYDDAGTAYLDLQMWYSAVNFGYKNKRLEQKMIEQLQSCRRSPASICTRPRSSWPSSSPRMPKEVGPHGPRALQRAAPRPSRIRSVCATPAAARA